MKKTAKLLMLIVLTLALSALFSCSRDESFNDGDRITIVVAEDEPRVLEVSLRDFKKSNSVKKVLDYLDAKGTLDFEMNGTMVTKVGELENEGNAWIYFYTTVAEDADVSEYATTVQYGDMTIISSGVGVEKMHLENGAVIYVGMIFY